MLTPEQVHEIYSKVRNYSSADDVEVLIGGGHYALTRFANNIIHQNVAEDRHTISVRVVFGQQTARASTNKHDDESLRRAVASCEALARVQQPDPELLPMATGDDAAPAGAPVGRWFEPTAAITPEYRADAVGRMVDIAKRHKLTTAGIYASSDGVDAIFNSCGVAKFHRQTSAEVSVTMIGDDSSGWQKFNSPNLADVDPALLAETAAQKAVDSRVPRELAPGKYTVVLEPAAVLDLIGFMFWDWGGLAILDQRSFLMNRVGTRLFGDNITIYDDAYHPLQSGAPFDGEGLPRQRLRLVDRGAVERVVYARGTAAKMRGSEFAAQAGLIEATGHGFPLPNEMGEAPMNIVVEPPAGTERSLADMVAGTERGILITRLWYIREVDPYEKILTGMTRDGTFLIENGKLQCGVRNFRFNQSLIEMLKNVQEMGTAVRSSGEESFDMVVPPMKVRDFNFTEVTKF